MAGDMRTSSVFCLNASPSTPIFLPLSTQRVSDDFFDEPVHLLGVDPLDFLEQAEVVTQLLGNLDEGAQVFGEATSAKAKRGIQEFAADARVHAHAVGHFLHVGAGGFAKDRNGVDVGNFQGQKRIGRVLDQFRGIDVRDDDRRVEGRINFLHGLHRPLGANPHHHPVGLHQVLDGEAFAQKFGIADHVEVHPGLAVALDRFGDLFAGLDRDGAFVHHDLVARHGAGDFARDALDETQIHRAIGWGGVGTAMKMISDRSTPSAVLDVKCSRPAATFFLTLPPGPARKWASRRPAAA